MNPTRLYRFCLLWITLLAWGLRVLLVLQTVGLSSPLDPADGLDEADYEMFAAQMAAGNGYVLADGTPSARRAPGTSLLILPVYCLFGRNLMAARLWITLLSALNCAAVAWVLRPRFGSRIALLSALLTALNPGLFYYALHLWSEAPYALIITLTTGCILRAVDRSRSLWSISAGIGWALAILLRPQVVFLAPCVVCAGFWLRTTERKLWFRELLCEAVVVLALIAPWVIRNQLVIGSPTIATLVGGHTFWGAHNGETFSNPQYHGLWKPYDYDPTSVIPLTGTEPEQDRQAWANGLRFVQNHLAELPVVLCWKLYRLVTPFEETPNRAVYWAFALSWILSLPFIALGTRSLYRQDSRLFAWIALHLVSVVLSTLLFYGAARFRHALEPFLMMPAAIGFARCCQIFLHQPTPASSCSDTSEVGRMQAI